MYLSLFRNVLHHSARIAAFLTLLSVSALAARAQVVFSPPKNISNTSNNSTNPQIAVDSSGNINVVWLDKTTPTFPFSYTAFFSRSSDGGVTFSAPTSISSAGSSAGNVRVAVGPSGGIFILWSDNSLGYPAVFFRRSADGGTTFSTPLAVSNAGANAFPSKMVVDSRGNINITWTDNSPGHNDVFFSHSADGGASFSSPVNVSNNPLGAAGADMSVDAQGNVYLAWDGEATFVFNGGFTAQADAVFFSSSGDGASFASPTRVTDFNGRLPIEGFQIAAGAVNNISILWERREDFEAAPSTYYSYSSNGGVSFQAGLVVSGCEFPPEPHMALDSLGGANIVVQSSCGNGSGFVGYSRSVGGTAVSGKGWSVRSNTPLPQLAVDSSNDIDVFFGGSFSQSKDQGATFSALQNGPGIPVESIVPDQNGNIYIVGAEDLSGANNSNIFFSRSVALASIAASLTDLTGGTSLTGTVTMNGPAPTGGAVVSLSSSDPSVSVPASVTIAEGTTSATFAVTTSPVATAATATVTATFSGVTQAASITVEPPVLTSLALSSSNVKGGSSTTATVTLSGPAPGGGSVIALSSSNTSAATVPSSVTVAPGFTNVTFTVGTSRELCSKAATISASFSGVTQTSNLAVQPFVNLPPQACAAINAH